jgi:2-pyrone-4,6-dicarboxylate lactonase
MHMTDSSPMPPDFPEGACNAHCHIFGPREQFPYAADAPFIPAVDAPRQALFELNDRLGLSRCVVVQSTCHGFDNRVIEDAIAARPQNYRGIALLRVDVPNAELRRLDAAGFRGVRFNYMGHLGTRTPIEAVMALAHRIAPLGWHLQLHGSPSMLSELAPAIAQSAVPVVIDHIGRIDVARGLGHADFQALLRLMELPHVWCKLSGIDRITRNAAPWTDALPFAQTLIERHGDRVLWGNDWPHPNHAGPIPDEDDLARAAVAIARTPQALQQMLVDNPQRLYRFGSLSGHIPS